MVQCRRVGRRHPELISGCTFLWMKIFDDWVLQRCLPLDASPRENSRKSMSGSIHSIEATITNFNNYIYFSFAFPFCTTQHQNKILCWFTDLVMHLLHFLMRSTQGILLIMKSSHKLFITPICNSFPGKFLARIFNVFRTKETPHANVRQLDQEMHWFISFWRVI